MKTLSDHCVSKYHPNLFSLSVIGKWLVVISNAPVLSVPRKFIHQKLLWLIHFLSDNSVLIKSKKLVQCKYFINNEERYPGLPDPTQLIIYFHVIKDISHLPPLSITGE